VGGEAEEEEDLGLEDLAWSLTFAWSVSTCPYREHDSCPKRDPASEHLSLDLSTILAIPLLNPNELSRSTYKDVGISNNRSQCFTSHSNPETLSNSQSSPDPSFPCQY